MTATSPAKPDKRGPRRTKATGRASSRKGRSDVAKRVILGEDISPPDSALRCVEMIAQGKTLKSVCEGGKLAAPGAPGYQAFHFWRVKYPALATAYREARKIAGHSMFDEAIDEARADHATPALVNSARLKVDTLKWGAARLDPHEYGDRVTDPGGVHITIHTSLAMKDATKAPGASNVYEVKATTIDAEEPPQPPEVNKDGN